MKKCKILPKKEKNIHFRVKNNEKNKVYDKIYNYRKQRSE